jgi:hypothetical protein
MAAADVGVAVGQAYRFVLAASAPSACTHTSVFDVTACFWMPLMLCLPRGASATSLQCCTSGMQFIRFPLYAQQLFSISNIHLASPPVCSHVTFRRILMNIAWATLYNFLMIPLAAGVFYPRCATPYSFLHRTAKSSRHHYTSPKYSLICSCSHRILMPPWASALAMAASRFVAPRHHVEMQSNRSAACR